MCSVILICLWYDNPMTKKQLYQLSVQLSGGVLRDFFGVIAKENGFKDMEANARRKLARKNLYTVLSQLLLDEEKLPNQQ